MGSADTIIVLASGPSVTPEQAEMTRGLNVMTVNSMHKYCDWSQRHYSGDYRWWKEYHKQVKSPVKYTMNRKAADKFGLIHVGDLHDQHYMASHEFGKIGRCGNSGMQAVILAYLLGFTKILLVGVDHQHTGGETHCHGDHPEGWPSATRIDVWQAKSPIIARQIMEKGVKIINCTITTAISEQDIPRMELKDAIEWSQA